MARRHGVSPGQLYYWRRTVRDRGAMVPISMVLVEVNDAMPPAQCNLAIEVGGARIMVSSTVDGGVLRTVFDALRR